MSPAFLNPWPRAGEDGREGGGPRGKPGVCGDQEVKGRFGNRERNTGEYPDGTVTVCYGSYHRSGKCVIVVIRTHYSIVLCEYSCYFLKAVRLENPVLLTDCGSFPMCVTCDLENKQLRSKIRRRQRPST